MALSSCSIRLRRSSSRPVKAMLSASVMSWMLPMPPPLSSNAIAASVCSVLGYFPDDASGISEPSCSLPCGGTSVGGASSMCSDPSRLVWPSLAVALAGSSHVAVELHRDQRMPALALDLGDGADVHVADAHPGVLLDVVHVGHLRLNGEPAWARALHARQWKRVQPSPVAAAGQREREHASHSQRRVSACPAS